jgi:hypothetical protein
MKKTLLAAAAVLLVLTSSALAHGRQHHRRHAHVTIGTVRVHHASRETGRPADCYGIPWCGCWLRHYFGLANRALNLARNWAHYGHATSPHIGAIVVWPHHVGVISGRNGSQWVVTSGNDGHAVRTRPRSLAGAIAFRE